MKYIIFVIDNESNPADGEEMAQIDIFNQMLRDHGHWITAAGINQSSKAQLIDNRSNLGEIRSGSLVTTDENYSGFWLIEAGGYEKALELALAGSNACNRKVELRPFLG